MSHLYYLVASHHDGRLERYERSVLRREGSRARAAKARRLAAEAKWR